MIKDKGDNLRFLIVEDDPIYQKMLEAFLESYGISTMVENGENAITFFEAALNEGTPYNMVCLDIKLPGIDGLRVLSKMRVMEAGAKLPEKTKIMILTASEETAYMMEAFSNEADAYLKKPIQRGDLIEQLILMGIIKQ
jgi:two-component system chemotaxis response regulator CheY